VPLCLQFTQNRGISSCWRKNFNMFVELYQITSEYYSNSYKHVFVEQQVST
jgi:hypothetical protein